MAPYSVESRRSSVALPTAFVNRIGAGDVGKRREGFFMWLGKKRLGVALTCADWRLHAGRVDLNGRLKRKLRVKGLDVNAVPGPDGLLRPERASDWQAVLGWTKLLIGAHDPVVLAVVAHQRCAGHPVSDADHDTDVGAVAKELKQATAFSGPAVAMVATYRHDRKWGLKLVGAY
jgi:hypothetical protein